MIWQLQEAKQKFSQLVRRALEEGPQTVTRHGEEAVVVISAREFRRLAGKKPDLKEVLLSGPPLDDLELERSREMPREIDLSDIES
jgi:prevent-host-death family protein